MIVKDLSNSFHPVPKIKAERKRKNNRIKQKSNKLAKLERNRYSIITQNFDKCYFCNHDKNDTHEVFRGRNRQKSMQWGLVVPLCSRCHFKVTNDKCFSEVLEQMARNIFVDKYGLDKFIEEFK